MTAAARQTIRQIGVIRPTQQIRNARHASAAAATAMAGIAANALKALSVLKIAQKQLFLLKIQHQIRL